MIRIKRLLGIILILAIIVSGCSYLNSQEEKVTIRVMAAASLTEVFNDIKKGFEAKYGDVELEVNYAGSQILYSQIESGIKADIFASANAKYMEQLVADDLVLNPTVFAHNKLVIAVSKKSALNIQGIEGLIKNGAKLVIADESVPVGRYTRQMLDKEANNPKLPADFKDKFMAAVLSKELDVKSVIAKVELGEADAGLVYQTDVNSSNKDKVRIVDIEDSYNVIATYPISILKDSKAGQRKVADEFLDYLYSDEGGKILEKHGFIKESRR